MIDHQKFQSLVKQLYTTVKALEDMFPGRHFTPDGHLVGSLGECLVADAYGLTLQPASNKGYDATSASGREVEIKATQADSVVFRSDQVPDHLLIMRLSDEGVPELIYNGPGILAYEKPGRQPANGQRTVRLSTLRKIPVPEQDRLKPVAE